MNRLLNERASNGATHSLITLALGFLSIALTMPAFGAEGMWLPNQTFRIITNGFLAASLSDEMPAAPGSRIYVIEDLRDVTAGMNKMDKVDMPTGCSPKWV